MRHQLYTESLLEKLRKWRLSNPDGTLSEARAALRKKLSEQDVDLLFDNWLNVNYGRITVRELKSGSVVAVVQKRNTVDPDRRRREAVIAQRLATDVKSNHFEEFADRIWNTALPNGVLLKHATGNDMKHATGWFKVLADKMKPNELVANKFTARQLYELAQRSKFAEHA